MLEHELQRQYTDFVDIHANFCMNPTISGGWQFVILAGKSINNFLIRTQ